LVGKPEEQIPLARPKHRWEDNFRISIREIVCEDVDWILLIQNRDQ
jgi:hypothetical protein